MNRKLGFILLSLVIAIIILDVSTAKELDINSIEINITTGEYSLNVEEILNFQSVQDENVKFLSFWIQDKASDIKIIYKGELIPYNNSVEHYYTINITSLNLNNDNEPKFVLDYKIVKNTESIFQKELISDTNSIKVVFDDIEIYTCKNLTSGSSFSLKLYEPKVTTLSLYLIIAIILIIILILVYLLYIKKKRRITKVKNSGASKELLLTKKELLMNLLKDIEKQHRGKEISDDTYHKLKEQYKQETVETMKQIEDIK